MGRTGACSGEICGEAKAELDSGLPASHTAA
jgi:hypothetical protein